METLTVQENHSVVATTPDQLLALAVDKNLDIDKLERLLAMKERWDKEQAHNAFFESLTSFQEECPDLRKTKAVHYKDGDKAAYHYAPLSDIDRQIKGLLKKHGLTKRFQPNAKDGKLESVTCIITHVKGHSESATVPIIADASGGKNAIQAIGSGIQYGQRYALIAALGITTADTDIDGRMPELDIDKLHKTYMDLFEKIVAKDEKFRSPGDPDNWAAERTPQLYVQAIGKARIVLANLTPKNKA